MDMGKNKRKKQVETVAATLQGYMRTLLDVIGCIYALLILVMLPFYNQEGYSYIGTDKCRFLCRTGAAAGKAALIVFAMFLVFWLAEAYRKRYTLSQLRLMCRKNYSLTDVFAGLYGISLLISYLCSDYKEKVLWGSEGWYMGFCTQMILTGSYFLVSRCRKIGKWIFYLILPVSAAVFLLGYLNRFGIDPLKMAIAGPSFISTIGNINWYCGYQVTVFFAGAALLWQGGALKRWQRLLLTLYLLIGFGSLVIQGSSSGIAALAVVMLVMFCLSAGDGDKMCRFWQVMLLLGMACLITLAIGKYRGVSAFVGEDISGLLLNGGVAMIVTTVSLLMAVVLAAGRKKGMYPRKLFRVVALLAAVLSVTALSGFAAALAVNTLHPGSLGRLSENPLFTFTDGWGSNRGATWKAGVMCFLEQDLLHKLVGVGPDGMCAFLYGDAGEELTELVWRVFPSAYLKNAHNEWLTILVNVGILGCVSYIGMISSAFLRFLKKGDAGRLLCACAFCLLAYTANNVFSFQQAVNVSTMFVILGIGERFCREDKGLFVSEA